MSSTLWFVAGWIANSLFCAGFLGALVLLDWWLARRRIKRAVRKLVGSGTWCYPAPSEW